jgi:N-acetyl sugar amidotransferase
MLNKNLEAYFGLPRNVEFCKYCVISNQRPSSSVEMKNTGNSKDTISFDSNGVCAACGFHLNDKKEIDWKFREKKLQELLEPYRSKDGSYDVLVPSSGGKDSSFTAHILKSKYGMNPLAVTWAPNIFTRSGWNNFQNLSHIGGIDSFLYTPSGSVHRFLTKLAFKNLGHPFQPFVHGQKIIGPKLAKKFGIKLIVYGENQAEYGNPVEDNQSPFMKPSFFSISDPLEMFLGGVKVRKLIENSNMSLNNLSAYIPPTLEEVNALDIKVTYLGYFEKWDPQECYYYAVDHTGFEPSYERSIGTYSRYTEIDDKIVPFHFYMTFVKFGIGRATYDAAQEVRNGKITRNEAVHLVQKYDGEFPERYFKEFLDYLEMERSEFEAIVNGFRSPHLWKRSDQGWKLRHTVDCSGTDDE